MKTSIELLDVDFDVAFEYRITSPERPAQGPSYDSGGEPPEPMEYEVSDIEISREGKALECPRWLSILICQHLVFCDDIYDLIRAEEHSL